MSETLKQGLTERFWTKVTKGNPNECWLWTSAVARGGYGQFWYQACSEAAHRVSWELAFGPVPSGMHVLHKCDVRNCVNPAHLFLGTNSDNVTDKVAKGRQRCAHGERQGSSKLTESDVRAIRALVATGQTHRAVAAQFSIDRSNVGIICSRKGWRHVP